jgi:hypothetical protein
MALGRQPLLHPWPHTAPPPRLRPSSPHLHQKEFGKPGALEEEEEALPLEKGDLSHASVPAYSISFLKKIKGREEKKTLLPVQEVARHLADKATRLLPPVHQERSRTGDDSKETTQFANLA